MAIVVIYLLVIVVMHEGRENITGSCWRYGQFDWRDGLVFRQHIIIRSMLGLRAKFQENEEKETD